MVKKILWILFVIFVFLFFSLVFYKNIWYQVINQDPRSQLTIQGETPVYEFVAETVKNNLLSFKNPFITSSVLYPFGWQFAMDDVAPINGLYFLILRPFLSIHQSFMLIVLLSVIISGLTMYYLLVSLKINKMISLLISLVFCLSPFMSIRIGAHPTYTAFYLFSIPSIFFIKLVEENKKKIKFTYSVLLAFSISLAFLTNLYFSIMIIIMIFFLFIFSFLLIKKEMLILLKKNFWYFLISFFILILILSPWLKEVNKIILLSKFDQPKDWNDITAFSADLTNFFLPVHGLFYQPITNYLATHFLYISRIFESFTYPGLIIIVTIIAYIFIFKK